MIYIFLECRDHSEFCMTSEETFISLLWGDQVTIKPCEGNLNLISKLSTFEFKSGDAVYIHYDTINAALSAKQALFQQVVKICKCLISQKVDCFLFRYLSFEHCILCTTIIEQLVISKNEMLLQAVRFFNLYDNLKGLPEITAVEFKERFPSLCQGSSKTLEACITDLCNQVCLLGGKFFICTKSKLGSCWVFPCSMQKSAYRCIRAKNTSFSTDLCEHENKQAAILNALEVHQVEELYLPLKMESSLKLVEQPTHVFT